MSTHRPYGNWDSPLSPDMMAGAVRLADIAWSDHTLVWREERSGQGVLVAQRPGQSPRDITGPSDPNIRGGVGYGGGAFGLHGHTAFFAATDGRLYSVDIHHGAPKPLTPAHGGMASPTPSPDGDWVVYVHSDHHTDVLAIVDAQGQHWPRKLTSGADFYMQPAFSPSGDRLAWIAWDHPGMPWDGTRLETAAIHHTEHGPTLGPVEVWAGGDGTAVQQPTFSPDGRWMAWIDDRSGFANLQLRDLHNGQHRPLTQGQAEFCGPAWVQGLRNLAWTPQSDAVIATHRQNGITKLVRIDLSGNIEPIASAANYTSATQPALRPDGRRLAFVGSSSTTPERIVSVTLGSGDPFLHAFSIPERIPSGAFSPMTPLNWTDPHTGAVIYANHYPPHSLTHTDHGPPPAIIMIHGGPTVGRDSRFSLFNQFFATRGFAVLDVNYRGSAGYGRAHTDALKGQWGVYDVEDAVSAARYMVAQGLAAPGRVAIMGGSAGGYTVLQALTDHPGVFAAGVCMYGISDLLTLDAATHKFESSYCAGLIGPLPEALNLYKERSPIHKADRITDALAIYHGKLDRAVPIDQAEAIVASLQRRNAPHLYHVYDDEGHGWRKAPNIHHFHQSAHQFLVGSLGSLTV